MNATQDLTHGNVRRTLIRYATPMVLTNLTQSLYSIVDMIIVGQFIGGTAVSAVNNGSLIMALLVQIAIGFTVGGNIVIGQFFGAKRHTEAKSAAGTLTVIMLCSGIVCSIAFFLLSRQLLILLEAPALDAATTYLRTCSLGIPFIFMYNGFNATLRAVGNSKKPFHFIACAVVLNLVLDTFFVVVLQWGIFGTAFATLLSQIVSFSLALRYVHKNRDITGFERQYLKINPEKAGLIVRFGFPLALQSTVASVSWLVVAYLYNKYGTDVSAANGISNKIKEFCQLFINAISSATATMIAQNIGAKEYERAKQVMFECLKMTTILALIFIAICEIGAPYLVAIFIDEPEVATYAITNLRIEILAQVFYAGFYSFNVLATGSGHTFFVMFNSFLNCIVVRLILAVILEGAIGLHGIYWACMIAPFISVPVGYWFYRSNKWRISMR
ncbi:MATE family efflux transporter [Bengtsoniella intestinalis]|uniref:MATE family efflux transporter n=1 Tax=Bengtsoniella intestinalis TaxID=3073143 RepID=UPI00391FC66A